MGIAIGNTSRFVTPQTDPQPRQHLVDKMGGDKRASAIPCPMISTLVMEGMLTPDKDGNVSVKQMKEAFEKIGIGTLPRLGLAHFGAKAIEGSFTDHLSVFKLFG